MGDSELQISVDPGRLGGDLGPYRLLRELGSGGMGTLYLGEHRTIGRRMAIKVLHPELGNQPEAIGRFFDEARSVNQINHEHIVEIYDLVAPAEGPSYLVMEWLEGRDLEQERASRGPFKLSRVLDIGLQVCSALAAVHRHRIVHRDLKPENIFLVSRVGRGDFVKLLDFGLAKLWRPMPVDGRTQAGTVVGTPEYMSPEQSRGNELDGRSDLYSLGVVLHWMIADRLPFESTSFADLVVERQRRPPRPLKGLSASGEPIPKPLSRLVARCLRLSAKDRLQSADEVAETLRRVVLQKREPLTPTRILRSGPHARRNLWGLGLGGALLTLALVLALLPHKKGAKAPLETVLISSTALSLEKSDEPQGLYTPFQAETATEPSPAAQPDRPTPARAARSQRRKPRDLNRLIWDPSRTRLLPLSGR